MVNQIITECIEKKRRNFPKIKTKNLYMVFHEKPIKIDGTLAYVMAQYCIYLFSSANKRVLRLRQKNKRITCNFCGKRPQKREASAFGFEIYILLTPKVFYAEKCATCRFVSQYLSFSATHFDSLQQKFLHFRLSFIVYC